jgi:curved DNA-binding protein CbpA
MTLHDALRLFQLSENPTTPQLAASYRRLVKHYHPDYNPTKAGWAHRRMTQVNEAYSLVCEFLADTAHETGRVSNARGGPERRAETGTARGTTTAAGPEETPREILSEYQRAASRLLDGIYVYYQYGLQNVHRRREGTPRLRYRQAVRHTKAGIADLDRLLDLHGHTIRREGDLKTLDVFAKSFLQNMLIEKYYIPSPRAVEQKAYRHYQSGSEHLDRSIQHTLFGEQLQATRVPQGSLYVSHQEFLALLVNYRESTWVPEAMIKLHLVDTFSSTTQAECFAMA